MSTDISPTALIAEDEPLLAAALKAELSTAWPELRILATVGDGMSAVRQALDLLPDVLFFDIRMPGMTGLDAAVALADTWPINVNAGAATARPFPALVFVTAYDQYAVQAFEAQAIDYVLKPVQAARLQKTVSKLRLALANRTSSAIDFEATMAQLRALLGVAEQVGHPVVHATREVSIHSAQALTSDVPKVAPTPLRFIQASVGTTLRMVPIDEVVYFEAADKYIRVLTAMHEYLIRTPLKELLLQLDPQRFWQVHRSTVVQASLIESVTRDDVGKLWLSLRGISQKLPVSRLYAHLFKAM